MRTVSPLSTARRRRITGIAAAAAVLLLGLSYASAVSAGRQLVHGRQAMDEGKTKLLDGDAQGAARSFEDAARSFSGARSDSTSPWMRTMGWLPILGRTPDVVSDLTEASLKTARAARELSVAISNVPGGIASLAPSRGRVPLERLAPLIDAVKTADDQAGQALQQVEGSPSSLLIGPVADARRKAEDQLRRVHDTLHSASLILRGLPAFLGSDRPQRFFLGAANPAEARGAAGFIGAYSILTLDRGRLSFSPVRPIESLPILNVRRLPAPNPDYARIYNRNRDGNGFWLNINATPDYPSAAQAIEIAFEKAMGESLDGVITVDPFALQALLKVTGPALIPGYGIRLSAGNVVDFTTNRAYSEFRNPKTRKVVLGSVATSIFERFAQGGFTVRDLRLVANSAAEGHIQVYSDDVSMQAGLARSGMGGSFGAPDGSDFLAVSQNSASGSKVDYYLDRKLSYSILLGDEGAGRAALSMTLDNHAPRSGQPRYVIGPFHSPGLGASRPGEDVAQVDVFCGVGCTRIGEAASGDVVPFGSDHELGYPFNRFVFRVPSRASASLHLRLGLRDAWQGNSSGGAYRLTFLNQQTIRPTRLRVDVSVPTGMHVVEASPGMTVTDRTAMWQGVPPRRLELYVRFRPPLPVRVWRDIIRFLSTPVIRF